MNPTLAALTIAGTLALPVAACDSSPTSTPTTSPSAVLASPTSTPPSKDEAHIRGLIASVAGNAAQVNRKNGTATVDFTDSTKVTEVSAAAPTDVVAGSCVSVRSKDDAGGGKPVTAAAVRVTPAVDGKCPPAKESGRHASVQGTVTSVAGTAITVNTSGGPQTVTVTDKTKYTKESAASAQAIVQGKCLTAQGSQNGGALQATSISLRPAVNGQCGGHGQPRRR